MARNQQFLYKENPFMTCILDVRSGSSCQKTISKVVSKCQGVVYNFRMDEEGTVEISGTIDPDLLLKALANAGSKAQIRWLQYGECSSNLFMPGKTGRYLEPSKPPRRTPSPPRKPHLMPSQHQPQISYGYPQHYNNNNDHYNNNNNNNNNNDYSHCSSYADAYALYQQRYDAYVEYYNDYQKQKQLSEQNSSYQQQAQVYEQKRVEYEDYYEDKKQRAAFDRRQEDCCVVM